MSKSHPHYAKARAKFQNVEFLEDLRAVALASLHWADLATRDGCRLVERAARAPAAAKWRDERDAGDEARSYFFACRAVAARWRRLTRLPAAPYDRFIRLLPCPVLMAMDRFSTGVVHVDEQTWASAHAFASDYIFEVALLWPFDDPKPFSWVRALAASRREIDALRLANLIRLEAAAAIAAAAAIEGQATVLPGPRRPREGPILSRKQAAIVARLGSEPGVAVPLSEFIELWATEFHENISESSLRTNYMEPLFKLEIIGKKKGHGYYLIPPPQTP